MRCKLDVQTPARLYVLARFGFRFFVIDPEEAAMSRCQRIKHRGKKDHILNPVAVVKTSFLGCVPLICEIHVREEGKPYPIEMISFFGT